MKRTINVLGDFGDVFEYDVLLFYEEIYNENKERLNPICLDEKEEVE